MTIYFKDGSPKIKVTEIVAVGDKFRIKSPIIIDSTYRWIELKMDNVSRIDEK